MVSAARTTITLRSLAVVAACAGLMAGCTSVVPNLPVGPSSVLTSLAEDSIAPVTTSFAGIPSQRHWTAFYGSETRFTLSRVSSKVLSRLLTANGMVESTAIVGVYACDNPGASTWIPERSIAICRSTVRRLETEDQLAFIIAHELSHILLSHCPGENASCQQTQLQHRADVRGWAGAGTFVASLLTMGGAGIFVAAGAGLLENGISAPLDRAGVTNLDRADEEAADRLALKLMTKAGYSPLDARSVLQNLTGGSDVSGRSAIAPDWSLAGDGTGNALFTMDLLKEITESMANRNLHPTGAYRIDRVSDLIGKYYRDDLDTAPTPVDLAQDVRTYETIAGMGRLSDGNLALTLAYAMLQSNRGAAAIEALDKIVSSGNANARTYLDLAILQAARGYVTGKYDGSAVNLALIAYQRSGGVRYRSMNGDYMHWSWLFMALGDYGTASEILNLECSSRDCGEINAIMRNISDDSIAAYQNEDLGRASVLLEMYVPSF